MPPFGLPALILFASNLLLLILLRPLIKGVLPSAKTIFFALSIFPIQCACLWMGIAIERDVTHMPGSWIGKILSIGGVLLYIRLVCKRTSLADLGVRPPKPKSTWLTLGIAIFICSISWLVIHHSSYRQAFSLNTFLYMLLMSGVDEELVFRGVMPALLAVRDGPSHWKEQANSVISWALPTAIFSLVHAWRFAAGSFSFSITTFVIVGCGSCVLVYVRQRTGSLVNTIIVHNTVNAGTVLALAMA